jgi:antibiotic biosynthesis monooxygenase (ABM) superfamily enzyme
MNTESVGASAKDQQSTVVITHRLREDKHAAYERWLEKVEPICKASPGHRDWTVVRPVPGLTDTYTVVIRFETKEHLRQWMESPQRRRLIEELQPLFADEDSSSISSGLDFWFPRGAQAQVPVRWKQYLATWSAIYPLALGVPLVVEPVLARLGAPPSHAFTVLVVTAVVVFLMVYVVMPRYTRLIRRWLFN